MLRFDNVILLVSGIPATGKSTFAKYLVQKYNFTHFDLEQPYQAWPDPDLHAIWDQSRSEFVKHLRSRYKRVVSIGDFPNRVYLGCKSFSHRMSTSFGLQGIFHRPVRHLLPVVGLTVPSILITKYRIFLLCLFRSL